MLGYFAGVILLCVPAVCLLFPPFFVCFPLSVSVFLAPPRLMLDPPQQMVRPGDSPLIICTMISGDQPVEIEWVKVCSK